MILSGGRQSLHSQLARNISSMKDPEKFLSICFVIISADQVHAWTRQCCKLRCQASHASAKITEDGGGGAAQELVTKTFPRL